MPTLPNGINGNCIRRRNNGRRHSHGLMKVWKRHPRPGHTSVASSGSSGGSWLHTTGSSSREDELLERHVRVVVTVEVVVARDGPERAARARVDRRRGHPEPRASRRSARRNSMSTVSGIGMPVPPTTRRARRRPRRSTGGRTRTAARRRPRRTSGSGGTGFVAVAEGAVVHPREVRDVDEVLDPRARRRRPRVRRRRSAPGSSGVAERRVGRDRRRRTRRSRRTHTRPCASSTSTAESAHAPGSGPRGPSDGMSVQRPAASKHHPWLAQRSVPSSTHPIDSRVERCGHRSTTATTSGAPGAPRSATASARRRAAAPRPGAARPRPARPSEQTGCQQYRSAASRSGSPSQGRRSFNILSTRRRLRSCELVAWSSCRAGRCDTMRWISIDHGTARQHLARAGARLARGRAVDRGGTTVPMQVWLLGDPWVLARLAGDLRRVRDRCPHRFAPLERGPGGRRPARVRIPRVAVRAGRARARNPRPRSDVGAAPARAWMLAAGVCERFGLVWLAPDEPVCDLHDVPRVGRSRVHRARDRARRTTVERAAARRQLPRRRALPHRARADVRHARGGVREPAPRRSATAGRCAPSTRRRTATTTTRSSPPASTRWCNRTCSPRSDAHRRRCTLTLDFPMTGQRLAILFVCQPETRTCTRVYKLMAHAASVPTPSVVAELDRLRGPRARRGPRRSSSAYEA